MISYFAYSILDLIKIQKTDYDHKDFKSGWVTWSSIIFSILLLLTFMIDFDFQYKSTFRLWSICVINFFLLSWGVHLQNFLINFDTSKKHKRFFVFTRWIENIKHMPWIFRHYEKTIIKNFLFMKFIKNSIILTLAKKIFKTLKWFQICFRKL